MNIAFYIITGIVLFTLLRFVNKVIHSVVASERIHPTFLRAFPILEFLLWFLYIMWALRGVFSHWDFYNVLMYSVTIAVIIGLAWFLAKDFIAGIVLKSEIPFKTNQQISLLQTEGVLKNLGYRSLEIETESGELIKIPYSRLTSEVIKCQPKQGYVKGYETTVIIESSMSQHDAYDLIVKELLLLPWTLHTKKPTVKLLNDKSDTENKFLVKYFAINAQHAAKISHYIKTISEKK